MRVDKLIAAYSSETSDEEVKDRLASLKHKLEGPILDDLVKGIQELNINLNTVKLEGLSSKGSTSNSRPRLPRRDFMWCEGQDHEHQDCDDFHEVYKKNTVFWKDNKIHLRATGEPSRVISKADDDEAKAYGDLGSYALKTAKRVYAYIAKSEANEAWVEEKQKRDEETAGSSKRATESSNKKEEVPKPMHEVNMEDAPKDKKQGKPRRPSYKLKSDIELATDLKKVFEQHILNSKVEMTLGDILGIAKHEFHEEIMDIFKRKWQIPSD
ncbi:hypothetical protein L7F22_002571 [Adiantum nelumboides]|nr:hypothetical protein [Adiantum nelumboides]